MNLDTALAAGDLKEGEVCYSTDENGVYVIEGGSLVKTGGDTGASLTPAPASATSTGIAGELRFDSDYLYLAVATDTWKRVSLSTWSSEGVNDLTAATGGVLNYFAEYTGNGTTQSFTSDAELSFIHIGSYDAKYNTSEGGALYWNLDGYTTDFPIGYMKNIEGTFSNFKAPDSARLSFNATGFTVGSSPRTNTDTALNVAVGFRKDGTKTLTNSSGPDSIVYMAEDAGVQVIQWIPTGNGSDLVYHGMNGSPDIIFWSFSDYDNSGTWGESPWYYNGPVFENVAVFGSDAQGTWRLDNLASTIADRLMTFTATSFTTCSNTYGDFSGGDVPPQGVFIAIAFKNTAGVVDVGVCSGAGGSVLSTNCGFRPKLVWYKAQDGSELWQQQLDNASSTGNKWGGIGEGWDIATDITITATGFDLPDGVPGNNGSIEGVYVAIA